MRVDSIQSAFFRQLADPHAMRRIFDFVPEVYFFVKNRDGLIMAASEAILARLGLSREEDFIGRDDYFVFPKQLADAYAADDEEVFRTGKPLVNRLELWLDERGRPDWCVTTKVPLYGRKGEIVGLMGLTRRDADRSTLQPNTEVTRAIDVLRQNASRVMSNTELAVAVGTSERTLNRKVNEAMGIAPYELMLRVRVQMAAEALLQSGDDIASIAVAYGFCDQSAFTQHFRKRMGLTPAQFRKQHQALSEQSSD